MAECAIVDAIIAGGVDRDTAEDMADRVFTAILDILRVGRTVGIPDVGRLRTRKVRKRLLEPGKRQMAAEEVVVVLQHAATLSRGEPYEVG